MARALTRELVPNALLLLILFMFMFPIWYLVLTALRPERDIYYVLKGDTLTFFNFGAAWDTPFMKEAFFNSALVATLSSVLSMVVTVPSGYMLARFANPLRNAWFVTIYIVRTIPYIAGILPLFLLIQQFKLYDTYWGVLIPHVAVHITFYSWIMRGFFEGIEPHMEEAAQMDGCSRWGAFLRIVVPQAIPGMTALLILGWLYSWSEFLFALILTSYNTPLLTVLTAQFVHEMGIQWNLMAATAVMAMIPPTLAVIFAQRYIVQGLKL